MMNKDNDIKEEEKQDVKWGKIMEETNELKKNEWNSKATKWNSKTTKWN